MKFTTQSGTRYIFDGVRLTRLSERPIGSLPAAPQVAELALPVTVGQRALFRLADGLLRTTPVTAVEP